MDLFNNRQRYYFIMRIECIFIVLFFFNTLSPNTDHCSHQHRAICKSPLTTEHNNPHTNIGNLCSPLTDLCSLFTAHCSLTSAHRSPFTDLCSRLTDLCSLFTLRSSFFALHSSLFILHSSLFTLHSSFFTLQTGIGIILCWFALFSRLKIANTWLCRGVR